MMYNFKANVYNTRLGPEFGTISHVTIIANNQKDAYKEAEKSFNRYIHHLNVRSNNTICGSLSIKNSDIFTKNKVRKIINKFAYNNLELCL